jgi:hypothetical protein
LPTAEKNLVPLVEDKREEKEAGGYGKDARPGEKRLEFFSYRK